MTDELQSGRQFGDELFVKDASLAHRSRAFEVPVDGLDVVVLCTTVLNELCSGVTRPSLQ